MPATLGELSLSKQKKALIAIEDAKEKIEEYLDPDKGTIKIGYPTSLANYLLPTVISAFKDRKHHMVFHLRQGSYSYLIDAVKNGNLDLAFLGPVPTKELELESYILFAENLSALLPIHHPLAERKQITLNELQNDSFVLFPEGYILKKIVIDACKEAGFHPSISSEGTDMDAIKGLVAAGIGVSLLPDSTFQDSTPRYTVKIPIIAPQVKRTVGVITAKNRDLSPSGKVFYEFVKEFFSLLEQYQGNNLS